MGTTLTGAGAAGGLSYRKEFKNIKMRFANFAKEKFYEQQITELEKRGLQVPLESGKDRTSFRKSIISLSRNYIEHIKFCKKILRDVSLDIINQSSEFKEIPKKVSEFDLQHIAIRAKFRGEVITEKIRKIAKNSILGAALGLAGGVGVIYAKYFYNKKKETP